MTNEYKTTYFYQALKQTVGATPPDFVKSLTVDGYLSADDGLCDALQDWAVEESVISWSTGIGCIDAAVSIVKDAISNANIEGDI